GASAYRNDQKTMPPRIFLFASFAVFTLRPLRFLPIQDAMYLSSIFHVDSNAKNAKTFAKFAENQALGLEPKAADSLSFGRDCVKKVADLRYFPCGPPGVRRQKEFRNNEEVFCIAFDRGGCRVHYLEL